MKRVTYFIIGCLIFFLIEFVLSGYGNKQVHPNINYSIIKRFEKSLEDKSGSFNKFDKYTFRFFGNERYKGKVITTGGLQAADVVEADKYKNSSNWIMHGGYSADEPELQASFRHFYNPEKPEGDRYLHDLLDKVKALVNVYLLSSDYYVSVDHLEWSLHDPDHIYSWDAGKKMMERSISYSDPEEKAGFTAAAYRALGETLHMIADLGCPAHVRDDAHPALTSIVTIDLGSPDIYEEIMESFTGIEGYFGSDAPDPALAAKFKSAQSVEEIAKALAIYTSKNFFTCQTITGNDCEPVIHRGDDAFVSPWLDDCTFDEVDGIFTKTISGKKVIMCKSKYYTTWFTGEAYSGYPYFDSECVFSQAEVLIPQILEAGANVYRLFIPKLKVEVTGIDSETKLLKGKVVHITDIEYPNEIKYNGDVIIYNATSRKEVAKGACLDGSFEFQLSNREFNKIDWEKEGVYATISVGDFYVQSKDFTTILDNNNSDNGDNGDNVDNGDTGDNTDTGDTGDNSGVEPEVDFTRLDKFSVSISFGMSLNGSNGTHFNIFDPPTPILKDRLKWEGSSFKINVDTTYIDWGKKVNYKCNAEGKIKFSNDQWFVSVSVKDSMVTYRESNGEFMNSQEQTIIASDIPFYPGYDGWNTINDNRFIIFSLLTVISTHYSYTTLDDFIKKVYYHKKVVNSANEELIYDNKFSISNNDSPRIEVRFDNNDSY